MAKEADLKKVELKVSVNCCDGCKKKVKKVLQSNEGVLTAEIDPLQPKVTVLGNVDPQKLIKKLLKAGKQAEIWSNGNQNAGKEKKEAETEKGKPKTGCEQAKVPDSCGSTTTDKTKEGAADGGDGNKNKDSKKDQKETDGTANISCPGPEVVKNENPPCTIHPSMLHDTGAIKSHAQCCYMVEPMITMPNDAIRSYMMMTHPPLPCYSQEYYHYERPVSQPPFQIQAPTTQVGDYFSDENTAGCYVM